MKHAGITFEQLPSGLWVPEGTHYSIYQSLTSPSEILNYFKAATQAPFIGQVYNFDGPQLSIEGHDVGQCKFPTTQWDPADGEDQTKWTLWNPSYMVPASISFEAEYDPSAFENIITDSWAEDNDLPLFQRIGKLQVLADRNPQVEWRLWDLRLDALEAVISGRVPRDP